MLPVRNSEFTEPSAVFEFNYKLVGSDWSEARVGDEHAHANLTASYLSDALGNLLEAVALVTEGVAEARRSFDEEPGEYRWILRRVGDDVVLTVLAFDEQWGNEPDSEGKIFFRSRQPVLQVGRKLLSEAQRLLDDLGPDLYARQWVDHPFPQAQMDRRRRAIKPA
jgi:hypothetical protein